MLFYVVLPIRPILISEGPHSRASSVLPIITATTITSHVNPLLPLPQSLTNSNKT